MNAKKERAKKTTSAEHQVDPHFAAKLAEAGRQAKEPRPRHTDAQLHPRVYNSRDDLVRMCSESKKYRAPTLYLGPPGDEWHAIARALDGSATAEEVEVAAKVMAATMAALAACLVDIDEASEWLELKTQAILAAMPILGAADRQFAEAGAARANLPPFRGTTIVEVGAALFHPLLRACAKSATQPSSVAPEAVEVAVASMRVMLRVNRRMADWLGHYFNGADSAVRQARAELERVSRDRPKSPAELFARGRIPSKEEVLAFGAELEQAGKWSRSDGAACAVLLLAARLRCPGAKPLAVATELSAKVAVRAGTADQRRRRLCDEARYPTASDVAKVFALLWKRWGSHPGPS